MPATLTTHRLVINGWRPALSNELMGNRHKSARLKRRDAQAVAYHSGIEGIPKASGPRRVRILIEGPFRRRPDPDAPLKSLLDALKRADLILDDSAEQCRWETPEYKFRREGYRTTLELEDITDGS